VSDRVLRFPDRTGTSSKDCRNRFGTPPTGPSFTCSKNQFRRLPTHFPKQIRYQVLTVSTFRRTA
jgi:hypothetical protein